MQLTMYTDYSLRVLIYLAAQGSELATISEIVNFYDISRNHLMKVVQHLSEAHQLSAGAVLVTASSKALPLPLVNY